MRNLSAQLPPCAREVDRKLSLDDCNSMLAGLSAQDRIAWAVEHLPGNHVLSSSFGAQSAVSLHIMHEQTPVIPVIFIDTGYHFPETYQFVDELVARLDLNLQVYRSLTSAAWQETRFGQRWLQGVEGLDAYNRENKVEPMQRAIKELKAQTWFAGLRRDQSTSRRGVQFVTLQDACWKVHPIADWTNDDIHEYLQQHELPYHPLWQQGYVSIGDIHTTKPIKDVDDINETRFFGLKRECGLHDPKLGQSTE
ncbi:MAG: phosphoadenylyl-sulfate reductase [Gammaproteobacteria bacterium]|nr:phosphoadenylyl-sulfate reductase [Gammaproteobacteria bacterium]